MFLCELYGGMTSKRKLAILEFRVFEFAVTLSFHNGSVYSRHLFVLVNDETSVKYVISCDSTLLIAYLSNETLYKSLWNIKYYASCHRIFDKFLPCLLSQYIFT